MTTPQDSDRTTMRSYSNYRPDETPAEAVVAAVAEETGQSPVEMDQLWNTLDTDALNRLFRSPEDHRSSATVTFDYCGQRVTVTTDSIQIAPSDSPE